MNKAVASSVLLCSLFSSLAVATTEQPPTFEIRQPTIVAFFPPVTQTELSDGGTNEALADFQYYAEKVREPLRKLGIEFKEVYARSFRIRLGRGVATFRPGKVDVGYYFVAPGKKPRVEYGVLTDDDLLHIAKQYFDDASK